MVLYETHVITNYTKETISWSFEILENIYRNLEK
jgi:hypothetical protein